MGVSKTLAAVCIAATLFLTGSDSQQALSSPLGKQSQTLGPLTRRPFVLATLAEAAAAPAGSGSVQKAAPPPQAGSQSTVQAQSVSPPLTQQQKNQQQRDQQLIDAVEQAYQAGVNNYRAGHVEAAKANFDYAVDQLLMSGLDIKNDPQLSAEFEHIVDAVNTLEMEALKQGNGFQPHTEPTPVDVANDVTFAVDPTLKAQAQADLKTTQSDLPLVLNDYVASYINYFTNTKIGHNTLVNSLTRASRYKQMIQRVLADEGVPQDLIYQAVAESGFQVRVMNGRGSGAGGMWQFMPGDAHAPPRSAWYDQRFDPEASTRAYGRYIKFLYNQMGDWYLAMAAYDWGAGNVQRAVQRTGYADFWELYRRNALPEETKNYVPIILAATIMAKNPKQYGLDSIVFDPPLITDTVTTNYSVDLRLVSDIVEAPVQEIVALNPSLLRMATPPDESFELHLPPGTKAVYLKRIEEVPVDRRKSWRFHKVAPDETLEEIARSYHVSPKEIAFVNQLGEATDLTGTGSLIIPVSAVANASPSRSTRYVAKRGDTLVTIADRFNVSVDELRGWNHLRGAALTPGHSLYVSEPAHIVAPHGSRHSKMRAPARAHATAKPSTVKTAARSSSHTKVSHSAGTPTTTRVSSTHAASVPKGTKQPSSRP
ncbi:Membrane-bound lytic murein transglycosylase D precursor [Acidisarcina polymorpha]|uniref:Membrane-bound lytic murein transglycosylase D n=1 Tax=Acidisarcina polymorpha TaxID=2211140 RepID=A0A2Z5FXK7_9BACT|nr:transglycosylase SLT domain-containing protein [Acidisarcina polymorpha]AXC11115.1 Membrane-bound lytic murein transglycosylase D precursor [Acidisarcina polymorpha]